MSTINKFSSPGHQVRGNRSGADGGPLALLKEGVELIQGDKGLGIALVAAQKAEVLVTIVDTSQETINKGLNSTGPLPIYFHPPPSTAAHADRPQSAKKSNREAT